MRKKGRRVRRKRVVDQIYEHLLRYGGKSPLQLAKDMSLDISTVRSVLKKLEKRGKIQLKRPLIIPPTPARVVPPRVPERIQRRTEEQLEKARSMQRTKVREKLEEIKRRRKQLSA